MGGGAREREVEHKIILSPSNFFFYAAALFEFVLLDGNNELVYAYQIGYSANIAL